VEVIDSTVVAGVREGAYGTICRGFACFLSAWMTMRAAPFPIWRRGVEAIAASGMIMRFCGLIAGKPGSEGSTQCVACPALFS